MTLAVTEFKLRFFGSVLGYLWTLVRPLMLFGVLYFVFTKVVRFGADVPHYPVYLLQLDRAVDVLRARRPAAASSLAGRRENLLRKMRFPRLVIPLVGGAERALQPRPEPDRVLVFLLARRRPDWTLARADPARRAA